MIAGCIKKISNNSLFLKSSAEHRMGKALLLLEVKSCSGIEWVRRFYG